MTILPAHTGSLRIPNAPVPLPIPVPLLPLCYPKDGGDTFLEELVNIYHAAGCQIPDAANLLV
jgi:hypothetical protein